MKLTALVLAGALALAGGLVADEKADAAKRDAKIEQAKKSHGERKVKRQEKRRERQERRVEKRDKE